VMDPIDTLIRDCRDASSSGQSAVHAVVALALVDHERLVSALRAKPAPWFFAADDLITMFCTEARAGSASAPHDHGLWSVLGCVTGAEESWWHKADDHRLDTLGHTVLRAGEVHSLSDTAVHSVMNRWDAPNVVVHVYGGNFLGVDRHIWDPITGQRHPGGLAEPYAPLHLDMPSGMEAGQAEPDRKEVAETNSDRLSLAGTAFAALAVNDLSAVVAWFKDTFGLTSLASEAETCAAEEDRFTYLIEPGSLTAIGIHQRPKPLEAGLDHLALRVTSVDALHHWREHLVDVGANPTPVTAWQFGTFIEVVGPEGLKIRLFVPRVGPR
jgi:predicted metal-dependent enzyme (double-stranded beta helix superfamily)